MVCQESVIVSPSKATVASPGRLLQAIGRGDMITQIGSRIGSVRFGNPGRYRSEEAGLMNRGIPPRTQRLQKSVIDEIRELKAQVQSKTEQAKAEALQSASEAINFLRELGIDNDTILKDPGFRARTRSPKEKAAGQTSSDEPCPICSFRTDPPHNGRSHRGQAKKKPFTAEELEHKGLTKV
jgi:hypothetical protein